MMKTSRKKTETTHESNDYISKKEKIWVDVSFKSGKNKYFETQIAETMINNSNEKSNYFSWNSDIFSFFSSIDIRSYMNIMKKKTEKSLDHISRQRRFITDSAMNSFMKKKNTFNRLYYFFASTMNYALAHWFLHSRCTQEFINHFFQDKRLKKIHDLLSFKNAKQLYQLINNISRDIFNDKWLRYSFEITFKVINVSAKKYYVEYHDVMSIIQFFIDHSSFADKLTYASIQQYNTNESQIYSEMHTANWWWHRQNDISTDDMIVSVLLETDKTVLTQYHDDIAVWSIYLTIDNLTQETWWSQISLETLLLRFISIVKEIDRETKFNIYHTTMTKILERKSDLSWLFQQCWRRYKLSQHWKLTQSRAFLCYAQMISHVSAILYLNQYSRTTKSKYLLSKSRLISIVHFVLYLQTDIRNFANIDQSKHINIHRDWFEFNKLKQLQLNKRASTTMMTYQTTCEFM